MYIIKNFHLPIKLCCVLYFVSCYCLAKSSSNYLIHYNTNNGLLQKSVKLIKFDRAGYYWLATELGLVHFDGKTFNTYSMSDVCALNTDKVKSRISDICGNIYGTTDTKHHFIIGGLLSKKAHYPEKLNKSTNHLPLVGYAKPNSHAHSLGILLSKCDDMPDALQTISIATGEIYLPRHEKLFYINTRDVIPLPDQTERFKNRQEAKAGEFKLLWCEKGTYLFIVKKLYRIDIKEDQLHAEKLFDHLDIIVIRNVNIDPGNRLWISSYGGGFYLYENEKVFSLPLGPKHSVETVHAFIDDGSGYFWQPNTNGLFKVSKQELMDHAYGKAKYIYSYMLTNNNGPRTNEFSGSCEFPFVWLQDRMLSISSIDGLLWFYLTAILSITLGAYLIYWLRLRNLTENAKMLEKLVDARTMELNKVVEQLVRSESALISNTEIKDKIITIVLHDLRSPISFLNTISNYLAKNHSLMDKAVLEKKLDALHSGTLALVAYTEQLFAWATTQHRDFKITVTSFKISDLLQEISGLYIGILKSRGNNLSIPETNLVCQTDYQILAIILRNLIDNANKNTSHGRIVLKAERDGDMITISVTDSGKGLNPEQARSFMGESVDLTKSGVGSVIILNMLKKINGSLSIKTAPDSGSIFSVTLHQYFQPYNAGQDY